MGETAAADKHDDVARQAADAGDPRALLNALSVSGHLERLQRRIFRRYPRLDIADAQWVVGAALDAMYAEVAAGKGKRNVVTYLDRVASNIAIDLSEHRLPQSEYDDAQHGGRGRDEVLTDEEREAAAERADDRRRALFDVAKRLARRIPQTRPKQVMTFLLDALAGGWQEVTNEDIATELHISKGNVATAKSRAFDYMIALAKEENLVDFDLTRRDVALSDDAEAVTAARMEDNE